MNIMRNEAWRDRTVAAACTLSLLLLIGAGCSGLSSSMPGAEHRDSDGDGVWDDRDPKPLDHDNDGTDDATDPDDDNDGVDDAKDVKPHDHDNDGLDDPNDADSDNDGLTDVSDPKPNDHDNDGTDD